MQIVDDHWIVGIHGREYNQWEMLICCLGGFPKLGWSVPALGRQGLRERQGKDLNRRFNNERRFYSAVIVLCLFPIYGFED
jgi:hypothetical protein